MIDSILQYNTRIQGASFQMIIACVLLLITVLLPLPLKCSDFSSNLIENCSFEESKQQSDNDLISKTKPSPLRLLLTLSDDLIIHIISYADAPWNNLILVSTAFRKLIELYTPKVHLNYISSIGNVFNNISVRDSRKLFRFDGPFLN